MRTVTCEGLDIYLMLKCAEINEAYFLCDPDAPLTVRAATKDDQVEYPGSSHVLSLTGDEPHKGVQRIMINTECGCFMFKVYMDCETPRSSGKHTATPRPSAKYCC